MKKFPFLTEKDSQEIRQAQKRKDPEKICEEMKKKGIRIIPYYSEESPPKLLQLADFPFALFVKGKLPGKDTEKAAIIGARNCTAYGEKYAVEYEESWHRQESMSSADWQEELMEWAIVVR